VDPTSEEESLISSAFTIVCNEESKLYSIIKSGGTPVTESLLRQSIIETKQRVPQVIELLQSGNTSHTNGITD
jgi:exosome complex RNA-binding protein Rrp42 (RNase PH superfamily)